MMFPTCFTLISKIFHKVPIYLIFNSGRQKNLFSVFLTYQELRDFKNGKVKEIILEFLRHIQQAEVECQEVNKPGGIFPLNLLICLNLSSIDIF
jgi:hypothetical protein